MEREELIKNLRELTRKVSSEYYGYMSREREYSENQKLYMREAHFIDAIGDKVDVSMSEIAEVLEITQGAATQIAERLEKKGLIVRAKDSNDKRRMIVNLTEQGNLVHIKHANLDKKRKGMIRDSLKDFTDDELKACLKYEQINMKLLKEFKLEEE